MIGDKYLNRENYSEIGKEVFDRLKKIWDQEDFLICTMNNLKTEKSLQKMTRRNFFKYIENKING